MELLNKQIFSLAKEQTIIRLFLTPIDFHAKALGHLIIDIF